LCKDKAAHAAAAVAATNCCCCCTIFRSFCLTYERTVEAVCGGGEWIVFIAEVRDGRLAGETFHYAKPALAIS